MSSKQFKSLGRAIRRHHVKVEMKTDHYTGWKYPVFFRRRKHRKQFLGGVKTSKFQSQFISYAP